MWLQVLVWSGGAVDHFVGGDAGQTWYAVFNPNSNSVGALQTVNLNHDMFCPGIAQQADGDLMIVGGSAGGDGAGSTSTWTGGAFTQSPTLNIPRGYNSAVTLANGNVCSPLMHFPSMRGCPQAVQLHEMALVSGRLVSG